MSAGGTRLPYRPEIDGLRAIAVLAVILYHTDIPAFASGFIGVDLFFVISGYLITGILAHELATDGFSIARFYERRVRRIIPALMLVMLLCIPFAVWLMLPDNLENFGQSIVGTTLFANNILLMLTTGYFGAEVQFKPLMHSWSLGIEEQYYLVVPVLMWAAWRWGKARGLLIGISLVTLVSFAACLLLQRYASYFDRFPIFAHDVQRFNFFMIFSRGWELGAGSLAILIEPRVRPRAGKRTAAALVLAGLLLAAYPFFLHRPGAAPGLMTAVHVAGVCLILLFGTASDPAGRLLASRPFVAIGLISYSAYLFHQPIFAFVRLASLEAPGAALMVLLVVPIFLCAWVSWRFVEQPCRDRARVSTRALLRGSIAAAAVVLAAGFTFHFTSGFYSRWPELADGNRHDRDANIAYNLGPERFRKVTLPAAGNPVRVLVLGNSFARDFINMALETGRANNHVFAFVVAADCPALPEEAVTQIGHADFIVLATRFRPGDVQCIVRRIDQLRRQTSAPIIVIGRKSFGYNNNAVMRLPAAQRIAWRVRPMADAVAANETAKAALPPATYVDMIGLLADARGRVPVFTPEGKFVSQDREHLTRAGAAYVGGIVFRHPALAALLAGKPDPR